MNKQREFDLLSHDLNNLKERKEAYVRKLAEDVEKLGRSIEDVQAALRMYVEYGVLETLADSDVEDLINKIRSKFDINILK